MAEPAEYVSHLRGDDTTGTACGERWQGWQVPMQHTGPTSPPYRQPRAADVRGGPDRIRHCGACLRIASDLIAGRRAVDERTTHDLP